MAEIRKLSVKIIFKYRSKNFRFQGWNFENFRSRSHFRTNHWFKEFILNIAKSGSQFVSIIECYQWVKKSHTILFQQRDVAFFGSKIFFENIFNSFNSGDQEKMCLRAGSLCCLKYFDHGNCFTPRLLRTDQR